MDKIKILAWHDAPAPLVHTGFAIVAKHILKALHNTDKYEIDVLGINYFGSFYNKEETPYHVTPAKLVDPNDPFGNKMLLRSLSEKKYDILFIINDMYVTQGITEQLASYKAQHNPNLKIIYYYPVDCIVQEQAAAMIKLADQPVTYTNYGKMETLKTVPALEERLKVIYHGTDTEVFRPLSTIEQIKMRQTYFGIEPKDNMFLWMNVNRNSVRKDLPKTIMAFDAFKKQNPELKTMLYLHTVPQDQGIDLFPLIKHLGLSTKTDVVFPLNYDCVRGFPEEILNQFYNCADCFITTTLGEGWGLTVSEAMAAGVPVIAPWNTSFPEILGTKNERGLMYVCDERVYVDNSGYRPLGQIKDIVLRMDQVSADSVNQVSRTLMCARAREWTVKHTWKSIGKQWVDLFDTTLKLSSNNIIMETV